MSYALFADVVSLILIFAGALLVLSAAIGVARFQDPMSRIHFVTKPQTVGLIFTILGAGIRVTGSESFGVAERGDLGILFLLVVFALATSPVTAQRMTRISRREGLYADDEHMSRNDQPATKQMRRK
ncbi:monovalent cation/H(+) antiporter subunit G [Corynebacterium stationis]|uniref:monovalent cation/H(+) antiporter subunit G n=1 Tax=Corynebacterium stationis TaxID=1705 RepID=UPI00174982FB|nr:monovalent cation/H(+) antiporter subunit G [Corynebacterium stationis]